MNMIIDCPYRRTFLALSAALALAIPPAFAGSPHMVSAGGRYHTENTVFTDLPYGNADLSYALAYTYSEKYLALKLGADFSPSVSGTRDAPHTNATDCVISPQASVIIKDRIFRGGVGILTSYIRDDQGSSDWLSPYWQMMLGLCVPVYKNFSLEGEVYYVLKNWGSIGDLQFNELEYGLWLNYTF